MPVVDRLRLGILASGEGTTLQSILDACSSGKLRAEVAIVIGNTHSSGALKRAKASGVRFVHLSGATHSAFDDLDQAILGSLLDARAEMVVLTTKAGRVTVAGKPSDDLALGTLNSILKQSGLKK